MDTLKHFETTYIYGNKEIMLMTTRSLVPIKNEHRVVVDGFRYKNEIKLYRYLVKKNFASITSSLIPLIITNENIEKAIEEAEKLFKLIRKNISIKNKIGITMLCYYLFFTQEIDTEFTSFTMKNGSKEEEIEFQKEKINIILGKKTLNDVILNCLEESDIEPNRILLEKLKMNSLKKTKDEAYSSIELYLKKLCNYEAGPKKIREEFSIENILKTPINEYGSDPFIGEFLVKGKAGDLIELSCKRGDLLLAKSLPAPSGTPTSIERQIR